MQHLSSRFLGLVVVAACAGSAFGDTIIFDGFDDISPLTLNGNAAEAHGGSTVFFNGQNVLRLTDANSGLASGSAFLTSAQALGDGSFSTAFEFQITPGTRSPGADGFTFTLQSNSPNALGFGGFGLGYFGIGNSLGIEFDTYFNGGEPVSDHVGVDLNGSTNSITAADAGVALGNGAVYFAWIDYDGSTDALEVRLATSAARPLLPLLDATVDLPAILGGPSAFVGFTGAIGGLKDTHDIRAWEFRSTYSPITGPIEPAVVPEPSTAALLAVGLGGLWWRRRRRGESSQQT